MGVARKLKLSKVPSSTHKYAVTQWRALGARRGPKKEHLALSRYSWCLLLLFFSGPRFKWAQGRGRALHCQTEIGLRFDYFGNFLVRRGGKCKIDNRLAMPNTEREMDNEREHGEKEKKNKDEKVLGIVLCS